MAKRGFRRALLSLKDVNSGVNPFRTTFWETRNSGRLGETTTTSKKKKERKKERKKRKKKHARFKIVSLNSSVFANVKALLGWQRRIEQVDDHRTGRLSPVITDPTTGRLSGRTSRNARRFRFFFTVSSSIAFSPVCRVFPPRSFRFFSLLSTSKTSSDRFPPTTSSVFVVFFVA